MVIQCESTFDHKPNLSPASLPISRPRPAGDDPRRHPAGGEPADERGCPIIGHHAAGLATVPDSGDFSPGGWTPQAAMDESPPPSPGNGPPASFKIKARQARVYYRGMVWFRVVGE